VQDTTDSGQPDSQREWERVVETYRDIVDQWHAEFDEFGGWRPSEMAAAPWLYVNSSVSRENAIARRRGKWLLFVPQVLVDDVWVIIYGLVFRGELGNQARVSTHVQAPDVPADTQRSWPEHVIYVYTEDADDRADVERVYQVLYGLGITQRIFYKADATTYAGLYNLDGPAPASLYYGENGRFYTSAAKQPIQLSRETGEAREITHDPKD
jgi:hypothetical protein